MTHPFITLPDDQPGYEELGELSMPEKAALPARFHTPEWMDSTPGLFVCRVCWDGDDMVVTDWPCATAEKAGRDVFGPDRRESSAS